MARPSTASCYGVSSGSDDCRMPALDGLLRWSSALIYSSLRQYNARVRLMCRNTVEGRRNTRHHTFCYDLGRIGSTKNQIVLISIQHDT